ncbi:MAG: flagellar basal-body rod modification protein FlgD [Paracoccaceae bacterium]|jgi:flagellar basal-body rod modification protein FlgD
MINALAAAAVPTSGTNTGTQTSTQAPKQALSSDFETFLKMLTAQARYQDPLEPIDSSAYAAQLAQFSMVEQQVKTNDALSALFAQSSEANMASLAGLVGMEARALAPAYFDGAPITVSPNPATVSDQVFLVVHDEAGTEVQRQAIPVSAEPIEWAGVDTEGDPLPTGTYSFTVESVKNGEIILSDQAEVYGQVAEAQVQNGQVILILEGGLAVLSSSVTGLRNGS